MGAAGEGLCLLVSSAGWQTAGLNLHKKTMPRLATGMGAAAERFASFVDFCGLANGRLELNLHKKTMPRLATGMKAAAERFGSFGDFCGLANGRLLRRAAKQWSQLKRDEAN